MKTEKRSSEITFLPCMIILIIILYVLKYKNYYLLIILIGGFCYLIFNHTSLKYYLLLVTLILFFTLIYYFLPPLINGNEMVSFLNNKLFNIRLATMDWIDDGYNDSLTSGTIELIVFNYHTDATYDFYHKIIDLSVVYLFVVSGFHISMLNKLMKKIIKNKKLFIFISFTLLLFYCYLLNFSVGALRSYFMLLIAWISNSNWNWKSKWKKLNNYDILGGSALLVMLWSFQSIYSVGFQLSFLCTLFIILLNELEIHNKLFKGILINLICLIISFPIVISMNNKVNVLAIINGFIFSYVIILIFIWFILTFWIIWIAPVQVFVTDFLHILINLQYNIPSYIYIDEFNIVITTLYYGLAFGWGATILHKKVN